MLQFVLWTTTLALIYNLQKNVKNTIQKQVFGGFLLITVIFLLGWVKIAWSSDEDFNLLLSYALVWVLYTLVGFLFAYHFSKKRNIYKAREHFGKHVEHLNNSELHKHLEHKYNST